MATFEYLNIQIARYVSQQPAPVGRAEVAQKFGISKSTAKYHLEKASQRGLLQSGFGYSESMTRPGAIYRSEEFDNLPIDHQG